METATPKELAGVKCPLCKAGPGSIEQESASYTLVRCESCDLVLAFPLKAHPDLYEEAYIQRKNYIDYIVIAQGAQEGRPHLSWAMRRFLNAKHSPGHLLDIGCSTGTFLLVAQRRGWQVVGVEVSETAAKVAQNLTGAPITVGTIMDFRSNKELDAVTAWEVLEHVPDPIGFIQAAVGHLKKGGVLALSVPNWDCPWMRRSPEVEHWPPFHLTYWNRHTLARLLQEMGLQNVMVKEKPFAWGEEVGSIKWAYLPVSLVRAALMGQKGMHLFAMGNKT